VSSDPADVSGADAAADEIAAALESGAAPPATFEFLVHTLFTQALMALGRIPNPITKQAHRNVPTAKHFIDVLAMLEQKTAGNLSVDERRLLEEVQHQLRLQYMEATT
jgi:hypothetical protein